MQKNEHEKTLALKLISRGFEQISLNKEKVKYNHSRKM